MNCRALGRYLFFCKFINLIVGFFQGAGTDHTVYKGNKRQCLKECVLIIDHQTGTFTLEKLTNNIQLKKTR
jgi:ELL-associated factor